MYHLNLLRANVGTKEYSMIANQRAEVEGTPSEDLARKYKVNLMPVKGLLLSKFWCGFKIAVINFNNLVKWIKKNLNN